MLTRQEIRQAIHSLPEWAAAESVPAPLTFIGTRSRVVKEPKGVVLIMSPWNYPFTLAVCPLVSAIAAGCSVVLKPSELSAHTSALLATMISEVFPAGQAQVVEGGVSVAEALLAEKWDHIFFTGSPRIGRIVMEHASRHLTPVTLELGGENPAIVDETAVLKTAAERLIWGKGFNAGQTCVAPNHVWVHRSVLEPLKAALQEAMLALYPGTSPHLAAMISDDHRERMERLVEDAQKEGGYVTAQTAAGEHPRQLGIAVVEQVAADSPLVQQEVFGPILSLLPYDDLSDLLAHLQQQDRPLALYFFSSSEKRRQQVLKATSSGTVVFNDVMIQFGHPFLPFGGTGKSGIGSGYGEDGFREFTYRRAVLHQPARVGITALLYPPYTPFRSRLIRLISRWL